MTDALPPTWDQGAKQWIDGHCCVCAHPTAHEKGRATVVRDGHVCEACRKRITTNLSGIVDLCTAAATQLRPPVKGGGGASAGYQSKPPITVSAVDPELTDVRTGGDQDPEPWPLLDLLEAWEREIRERRGFADYETARALRLKSAATVTVDGRDTPDPQRIARAGRTRIARVTMTEVVKFLRSQTDWVTTDPTFPVDDYATEIHTAWQALRRWDSTLGDHSGTSVACPTLDAEGGTCGKRLVVRSWIDAEGLARLAPPVMCPRCGVTRSADQLIAAAGADDAYVPAQIAAAQLGIPARTIRQWAEDGHVDRQDGRYRYGDIRRHSETRPPRRARS